MGEIVQSVPELARFAEIETEQFSNVASTEIVPAQWLALSKRINGELQRPDLAGIVMIDEQGTRTRSRVRHEVRRIGWLRFLDVIAFRVYYGLVLGRRDARWLSRL